MGAPAAAAWPRRAAIGFAAVRVGVGVFTGRFGDAGALLPRLGWLLLLLLREEKQVAVDQAHSLVLGVQAVTMLVLQLLHPKQLLLCAEPLPGAQATPAESTTGVAPRRQHDLVQQRRQYWGLQQQRACCEEGVSLVRWGQPRMRQTVIWVVCTWCARPSSSGAGAQQ